MAKRPCWQIKITLEIFEKNRKDTNPFGKGDSSTPKVVLSLVSRALKRWRSGGYHIDG